MSLSLQKRIHSLVRQTLDSYPGAWLVWCDPRGEWLPLLQRVADDERMGGFRLVAISERTGGQVGSPLARRHLQDLIDGAESFVFHVPAPPDDLGWLWAHALLAEQTYARSLRSQLYDWGWHPQSLTIDDDQVALLARQRLQQDPAEWEGGGPQPDYDLLLRVLAGVADPDADARLVLDLTTEQAGLPPIDEDVSDLSRWRTRTLAALLVTDAHAHAPRLVGEGHDFLMPSGQRQRALEMLHKRCDSLSLRARLPGAILDADRLANLGSVLAETPLKSGPFLSRAAEYAVYSRTCARLAQKTGKEVLTTIAGMNDDLCMHAAGFWGDGCAHSQALPWGELVRLSAAARALLAAAPATSWATPAQAIAWYTDGGWRIDRAGEDILRNLDKPAPELVPVATALRAAYRARSESYLIQWSETWTAAGCPRPEIGSAGDWMRDLLQQARPTAILTLDALRYDLGAALAEEINRIEGTTRATVVPARAALPSITALGMALAMPVPEDDVVAELHGGKWRVHPGDSPINLSDAEDRRAWWRERVGVAEDAIVSVADVLAGQVVGPAKGRTRLVLYDDAIDKLGHDDELEGMGASTVAARYLTVIQQLRDAGWLRILVTTDHGFIHWYGGTETNTPAPAPDVIYKSRRALAYPASVTLPGPQGLAPGGRYRVAVPRGAACFQTYGGLGYFHGGASLQEWIIPCLQIEWPVKAQPVTVRIAPIKGILSLRPHLTLTIVRSTLLTDDALPRPVEALVRDAAQNTILFRSETRQVIPSEEQVSIALTASAGVSAERGTPVRIEVRDAHTEEILDSVTTTLLVALDDW